MTGRWGWGPACTGGSGRGGEELERDAVRGAEAQGRAVVGGLDLAGGGAQLVQAPRPRLQLGRVGTAEGDVVQADPELAEALVERGPGVLVQAEQGVVGEQGDGVVEVAGRVLGQ